MLDHQDRKQLIRIIESHPLFSNYRGRKQLFEFAGLEKLAPQIDLEGAPFVVAAEVIRLLESYGRVTYEHHALGLFISAFSEFVGAADDVQTLLQHIMSKYDLMTPAKKNVASITWKAKDTGFLNELIINENTLKHVSFLQMGLDMARMVMLIETSEYTGTGFMISPELLMTNHHVIPETSLLSEAKFKFNYQLRTDGNEEKLREYKAKPTGKFVSNEALDYSIFELEESPGLEWGFAKLETTVPVKESRINIIQHPGGMPKQITFQNNYVEYADSQVVQYVTSTLGGSSGSPVFNDDWKVIAIHHGGGHVIEPQTNRYFFRNEGISMKAVLKDLPADILECLTL